MRLFLLACHLKAPMYSTLPVIGTDPVRMSMHAGEALAGGHMEGKQEARSCPDRRKSGGRGFRGLFCRSFIRKPDQEVQHLNGRVVQPATRSPRVDATARNSLAHTRSVHPHGVLEGRSDDRKIPPNLGERKQSSDARLRRFMPSFALVR